MQNMNITKRCQQCGCIYLADARRCPKCGRIQKYNNEKINDAHSEMAFADAKYTGRDIIQTITNIACSGQFELISATIVVRTR